MKRLACVLAVVALLGPGVKAGTCPANGRAQSSASGQSILPLHERDRLFNTWLKDRFDRILPEIMRRERIDMWIVVCREHNEDPVYTTIVPHPSMFAWRLTMFVFFDRGDAGIERLTVNRYGGGDLHK